MATQPNRSVRQPGPTLSLSLLLLLVGVLGSVICLRELGRSLSSSVLNAPVLATPGHEQVSCRVGTYVVYLETGTSSLVPGDVRVTAPDGAAVAVSAQSGLSSFSSRGRRFAGELSFPVNTAGTYNVTIDTAGSEVIVAPSFQTIARQNLGWVAGLLVGLLAALLGFILLIVGLVRRSSARKRTSRWGGAPWGGQSRPGWPGQPGWPQPGWPPQPGQPGGGWPGPTGWSPPPSQPGWPPPGQPGWPAQPGWPPPPPDQPQPVPPPGQPGQPGQPGPPGQPGQPGQPGSPPAPEDSPEATGWPQLSDKPPPPQG